MSTGPSSTTTAPPRPPEPVAPFIVRYGWIGEMIGGVLTTITLATCAVMVLIFLGSSIRRDETTSQPYPESTTKKGEPGYPYTGTSEALTKMQWYSTFEAQRQRDRAEQRSAVYQSAALAIAAALGFLAITIFFRTWVVLMTPAGPASSLWDRFAPAVPGVVALICAAIIIAAARDSTPPIDQKTPPGIYPFPTAVSAVPG